MPYHANNNGWPAIRFTFDGNVFPIEGAPPENKALTSATTVSRTSGYTRDSCIDGDMPLALSVQKLFSIVDDLLHRRFFVDDMF